MHDLLKIVGNSVSNVQIALISSDLGLDSLALPLLAQNGIKQPMPRVSFPRTRM